MQHKKTNNLIGLFFIGLILIAIFFLGGNASLLKQNIANWPKTKAKVISVESKTVCNNPEMNSACYPVFYIDYSYRIGEKIFTSQMQKKYMANLSVGAVFDVYYNKDNPALVFPREKFPTRSDLYLPLIFGLAIVIPIIILWIYIKFRGHIT